MRPDLLDLLRGRRAWSRPRAMAAPILLLAALIVPLLRYRISESWASALWGMVLLGAFVGWGGAINEWLRPGRRRGWGLDGAVGAAGFIFVGGTLAIAHAVSSAMIWTFVLTGVVALGATGRRLPDEVRPSVRPSRRVSSTQAILVAGLMALALLRYAEAVTNTGFNVWDDNMAYRQFAQKLIEIGSLYEPFSARRIASLGGQTMLDAALLAGAPSIRLHIIDSGLCVLLVMGLLFGYGETPARRTAGLLAGILFLAMPDPRHNIGSEVSGVVLFLALFRVLDDWRADSQRPWGNAVVLGLIGAGICTLRQSYLPAAGATVVAWFVLRMMTGPPAERRAIVLEACRTGVATFGALLPWIITSFVNARTFLFPLMSGNSNPGFGLIGRVNGWEEDRWFLLNIFYFEPVKTGVFFVVAGCLIYAGRRTVAIRAQLLGMLIGFAALVHSLQASIYYDSVERYYFSFVSAYMLALVLFAASRRRFSRSAMLLPTLLVSISVVLHVYEEHEYLLKAYTAWVTGAEVLQATRNPTRRSPPDALRKFYAKLQSVVPAHERLLVMVDDPYLLDFRRNDILNYDQPGAVSPRPHVPYFKGPEALAAYLSHLGIHHLAFVLGTSSPEYNYPLWRGRLDEVIAPGARGGMYKAEARFYIDAFDSFSALAGTRRVLFHEGDYWVLDLAHRT